MTSDRIDYLTADMAKLGIESADRFVVLSTCTKKTVFSSFNLNLKIMKSSVGLEIRIILLQLLKRSVHLGLRGLILGKLLCILKITILGIENDLASISSSLNNRSQSSLLMSSGTLNH